VKQVRIALWAAAALAVILGATLFLTKPQTPATQMQVTGSTFGGPFTLVGSDGKPFASSELAGKPYAIYFGFTRCPDTCPLTLSRMVQLRRKVGLGDDSFAIVFVSVDPERDGPKEIAGYEKAFGAPIVALTGSPEQIDQVKKQYGIFSKKVPEGAGDYTVDHTATVLLFDREGKFAGTIAPDEQDGPALEKLKALTSL
jgi:protein SCO1/2